MNEELIDRLDEFIRSNYYKDVLTAVHKEENFIVIDFNRLDMFDPLIADRLLEYPDEVISAFNAALSRIEQNKIKVHIRNIPERNNIRIRHLRAVHLNKFIAIEGIVRSVTEVKPQIYEAVYECPECGSKISVPQDGNVLQQPLVCECGRRGVFKLVERKMFDTRWLTINEPFEITTGEQPGEIKIFMKEELTTPKMQKKTDPGNRIKVFGILKEMPKRIKGKLSTKMDIYIEANHVEPSETEYEELEITPEDERKIIEMSKDPEIFKKLVASLAPGIYGFDEIKEAIVLQLFGGCPHVLPDGNRIRGNIHILLTGDPGIGKTMLLKLASTVVPRGKYVSGKGVTGAGLCTTGDTLIQLEDGKLVEIGKLVEERLKNGCESQDDIQTAEGDGLSVLTLTKDLKIKPKKITKYWKLKSPEKLIEIVTQSGRKIKVTPENPLPILSNGEIVWKPAKNIKTCEYLAVPRILQGSNSNLSVLDLIDYSARLVNSEQILNEIVKNIKSKCIPRSFAKKYGISENYLYHGQKKAPKLSSLRKFCEILNMNLEKNLPDEMILEQKRGHRIKLPKKLNEDIMYLFGLVAGDGSISKTKYGGLSIRFSSAEEELLSRFKEISEKTFSLNCKYYKHPERIAYLRFNSKIIGKLAEALGIPSGDKAHNLRVTQRLSELPNPLIAAYLRGIFDTDGYVSIRKTRGSSVIGFDTVSERFAQGIQMLLLRFGIISNVRRRKSSTSIIKGRKVISGKKWSLEIRDIENFTKFRKEIGFGLSYKLSALERLISENKKSNTNLDIIPNIGPLLLVARKKAGMSAKELYGYKGYSYEKGRRNPSRTWLLNKVKILAEKINTHEVERLRLLAHSDIYWDRVKEIKWIDGKDYVYDITVEDEHSFVANGMIIHNTATVRKDENLGTWLLEAGALILCNHGLISIDEFDKMSKEDQVAMHEAMSIETVSIAKASIVATLPAQTAVLAGANPKLGRFDAMLSVGEQIDIPETLLSRFDLKFALRDIPKRDDDEKLTEHIILSRITPDAVEPLIHPSLLRKYIAYSKKITDVDLTPEAAKRLENFYVDMRAMPPEGRVGKSVTITLRQFEALIRLAEASAKIRLDNKVNLEDAERAIKLMTYSLQQLGYDYETGRFDIDKIESGVSTSQRSKIMRLLEIIEELQAGQREVSIADIMSEVQEQGIGSPDEIEKIIQKLRDEGMVFEPRPGYLRKT